MRRLLLVLILLVGVAGSSARAQYYYLSPDVPTDDPPSGAPTYLPWEVVWHSAGSYALAATLPPGTAIDGLHRLCNGDWLFSVEAPVELPPGSGAWFQPEDVIRTDLAIFNLYFDGSARGIPPGVNVDALFLNGGDTAPLILSFDVPTTLGANTYRPADLVQHLGGFSYTYYFNSLTSLPPVPTSDDVTGADQRLHNLALGPTILTFDVPTAINVPDFLPGETVAWNGAGFTSFFLDPAWPLSSRIDALALPPDPGRVPPPTLLVSKAASFPPNLDLSWGPATSVGANDYAIYEGNVQALRSTGYSHGGFLCSTGGALSATISPGGADHYYLVVPLNDYDEGSYGIDSAGSERSPGTGPCRPQQALACP